MKIISSETKIELLDFEELVVGEQMLISRACRVRLNAQAPYSKYWVGCSLLTASGMYFDGCNVERVSWTQTTHAEQNAVDTMIASRGPLQIKMLAVVGAPEAQDIPWPVQIKIDDSLSSTLEVRDFCPSCGHCLQIIAENCFDANGLFDPTIPLLGYNATKKIIYRTTIGDALPMPFLPQHLGINYTSDSRYKK